MNKEFWLKHWQNGEIGFNQKSANHHLIKHFDRLGTKSGETLFVPLCGRSVDMVWIAEHDRRVAGVEFSEQAIEEFVEMFAPGSITRRHDNEHNVVETGPYRFYVGDYMALRAKQLPDVRGAYDRAALIAMPEAMRLRYATHFATLMPSRSYTLLLTIEYTAHGISGPPFSVSMNEVARLYSDGFTLETLSEEDITSQSERLSARGASKIVQHLTLLKRH